MFDLPRTPLELLYNLKTAFARDLVLQDNFYTDDNLKAFSGARDLTRGEGDGSSGRLIIFLKVEGLVPLAKIGRDLLPGLQYQVQKEILGSGKRYAGAHLFFRAFPHVGPSFEDTEALFGQDWMDYPIVPHPAHGWVPDQPTHRMGNKRTRYLFGDDKVNREIVLQFFADGSLQSCSISQETK